MHELKGRKGKGQGFALESIVGESSVHSSIRQAEGPPQGSALSCSLFLTIMNNIGDTVRRPSKLSCADDIILWQLNTDIDRATVAISGDLVSLKRFCQPRNADKHDYVNHLFTLYFCGTEGFGYPYRFGCQKSRKKEMF
ncbi:hypothetical protein PoB_000943600 [Plakobranchus ocellatus]|uniref:Reverse transcriptase domain-containing protein n=1 Tax=Plakobranchus ocellatus TaxID=259542 RepID=A0AAV3YKM0_9GAST|nr:hypothetical protein PoB_000943600 [Plakobranchus ocellatus]